MVQWFLSGGEVERKGISDNRENFCSVGLVGA